MESKSKSKPSAKSKPKPSPKSKPNPKSKKKSKNNSGIIVEKDHHIGDQNIDPKYSDKVNSLLTRIKNQNESTPDVKIRFGWKY